jgi:Cytochrome P460
VRHLWRYTVLAVCLCITILVGSAVFGGDLTNPKSPPKPDLVSILQNYKTWPKVNREPFRVNSVINQLCANPGQLLRKKIKDSQDNPHLDAYIDVYVNGKGRTAMLKHGDTTFPLGAVIVKEKRQDLKRSEPDLMTVMVKREKGYNPAVGDWDFAVLDGQAKIVKAEGRLASCIACHTSVSRSDYVYRSYLSDLKLKQP